MRSTSDEEPCRRRGTSHQKWRSDESRRRGTSHQKWRSDEEPCRRRGTSHLKWRSDESRRRGTSHLKRRSDESRRRGNRNQRILAGRNEKADCQQSWRGWGGQIENLFSRFARNRREWRHQMPISLFKRKWQTCKDSNLNKVNQNHLCYRYTTGLRLFYNIHRFFAKASSRRGKSPAYPGSAADHVEFFSVAAVGAEALFQRG